MYEVQQTRWDRIIRRVSGSIGPGSRVSETISELFPVLDVERVPGELLVLGGTRLAWGGATVSGVAAETAKVQLFNPVDSENLIIVTRVDLRSENDAQIRYTMESSARPDDAASARFRDSRLGILPTPVAEIRTESSAPLVPGIGLIHLLAGATATIQDENSIAVIAPGTGVVFGQTAANTDMTVSFFWRERPAEQSELSL